MFFQYFILFCGNSNVNFSVKLLYFNININLPNQNSERTMGYRILFLFCFIFYIAAQFDAAAGAFVSYLKLSHITSLLIAAMVILIYCLLGGFWAASVTDTFQAIIMIIAAITISSITVIEAGGFEKVVKSLFLLDQNYTKWSGGYTGFLLLGFLAGSIGIGIGTFGQPHLLARLMAVKGKKEIKFGFYIAIIWVIIIYCAMAWLGLAARSLLTETQAGEQIFYLMAEKLLPPVLAGIVIASILSAVFIFELDTSLTSNFLALALAFLS